MDDDHDGDAGLAVQQSRVDAAGKARPNTTAPNSVFALGQRAAADLPADESSEAPTATRADQAELLEQLLQEHGEMDSTRFGELAGISKAAAYQRLLKAEKAGKVAKRKHKGLVLFALPRGGFKGWLARKGEPSAEAPRVKPPRATKPAAKRPVATPRKKPAAPIARSLVPAPPHPRKSLLPALTRSFAGQQADDDADIVMRLGSDGAIDIETPDDSMRLNRGRAVKLLDWLKKVDAVLQALGEPA